MGEAAPRLLSRKYELLLRLRAPQWGDVLPSDVTSLPQFPQIWHLCQQPGLADGAATTERRRMNREAL